MSKDLVKILKELPSDSILVIELKKKKAGEVVGIVREGWSRNLSPYSHGTWIQHLPLNGTKGYSDPDYEAFVEFKDISRVYLLEKKQIFQVSSPEDGRQI